MQRLLDFCFGVKRAVETVYEQAKNSDAAPIYTYGPIIHNEEVVKDLENQGVIVLRTEQELEQLTEGTVIIRSHGVAKYIYEKLEKNEDPDRGCNLSICEEDPSHCKPGKCSRKTDRHYRESEASGGGRNPRLGRRTGFLWWKQKKMPLPLYWIRQEPYVLSPKRHLITINFKI